MPNPFFLELVRNTVLSGLVRALGRVAELSLRWPMRYRPLSSASPRPANFESSLSREPASPHCLAPQCELSKFPDLELPQVTERDLIVHLSAASEHSPDARR